MLMLMHALTVVVLVAAVRRAREVEVKRFRRGDALKKGDVSGMN